jgi:rhamnosyltransferase
MIDPKHRIAAVIVSYHPDIVIFIKLLELFALQVDKIYVIDNGSTLENTVFPPFSQNELNGDKIIIFQAGGNLGIAKALNIGIEMALSDGMDFIIFSDQDSQPAENMANSLLSAYFELETKWGRVGAIGPLVTDLHTTNTLPFQADIPGKIFYGHRIPTDDVPHVEALTLITSGTLVPVSVLREVGGMREDFFIDQVDIEWCHRARAKGYRLFGTNWAKLYQRMGEERLLVWYLRWRFESAYKPLRIYYRLRNFVALWKLSYVDWRWKVRSSWYWLGIFYAHVIFGKERLKTLKMACLGVRDGVLGRMGRHPESGLPQVGNSVPNKHL